MNHTTIHLSHFRKRCIGCQSSNDFSTRWLQWWYTRCDYIRNHCTYGTTLTTTCQLDQYGRIHQQPLYRQEYINDHLPHWSLRSSNNVQLTTPTTKTATAAAHTFHVIPRKYELYPENMEQSTHHRQDPSTNSAANSKYTCIAVHFDDRHSNLSIVVITGDELQRRVYITCNWVFFLNLK